MFLCVCVCVQALQLKVQQNIGLLQEFSGEEQISSRIFSHTQMLIQMCEDLGSQVSTSVTCSALICHSDLQTLVRTVVVCFRLIHVHISKLYF